MFTRNKRKLQGESKQETPSNKRARSSPVDKASSKRARNALNSQTKPRATKAQSKSLDEAPRTKGAKPPSQSKQKLGTPRTSRSAKTKAPSKQKETPKTNRNSKAKAQSKQKGTPRTRTNRSSKTAIVPTSQTKKEKKNKADTQKPRQTTKKRTSESMRKKTGKPTLSKQQMDVKKYGINLEEGWILEGDPHKLIGKEILRLFASNRRGQDGDRSEGTVVAYIPEEGNEFGGLDPALWRIYYRDDDDFEDLELHEVEAGIRDLKAFKAQPKPRTSAQNQKDFFALSSKLSLDATSFKKGDKVLGWDPQKKVLSTAFEAKIIDIRSNEGTKEYLLHFLNYSKSYDRWVPLEHMLPLDHPKTQRLKEKFDPKPVELELGLATEYKSRFIDSFPLDLKYYGEDRALHLQHLGLAHVSSAVSEEQVEKLNICVEQWFNDVTRYINTLGLQEQLLNRGFTDFKTRQRGRFDINPPALDPNDPHPTFSHLFANKPSKPAPEVSEKWEEVMRVIHHTLGEDCVLIASGCMLTEPNCEAQPLHQDGPHLSSTGKRLDKTIPKTATHLSAHAVNVFIPLVDITRENGGTEFYPTTHKLRQYDEVDGHARPVVPLARAGDAVIFDYRVKHRGLANHSSEPRPILYITFAKPDFVDKENFSARRYAKLPPQVYPPRPFEDGSEDPARTPVPEFPATP